ncbi:hypothetical protein HY633_02410 [Candidatus Uhrbacteria bacterium]|nr:hypothetical protein [Candidatus Uhrbacteria bacterium]
MKNVAFVTYNTVGDQLSSGWHDGPGGRRALLIQNTRGQRWGARSNPGVPSGGNRTTDESADRVRGEIDTLWGQLQQALSELDHVVVYVGANGSEQAIAHAAKLPASKVTFVGCTCGLPYKESMVRSAGLASARRVVCECGGHRTMGRIFTRFMETGELLPSS